MQKNNSTLKVLTLPKYVTHFRKTNALKGLKSLFELPNYI